MKLEGITKSYGEKAVLNNLSLTIPETEITAILAPSGSGKTTLLRIITGLEKPESGSVVFTKEEKFSYLFQEDRLLPFCTVIDNIKFIGADEKAALHFIEAVGLKGEEASLPAALSGGMKRRAALARALACPDYTFLLLDEPFNGQDESNKQKLIALIKKETAGKTCIVITHSPEDAKSLTENIKTL